MTDLNLLAGKFSLASRRSRESCKMLRDSSLDPMSTSLAVAARMLEFTHWPK
jgi:hypothetical protein